MCLVVVAVDQHPRFPLVIASNRDEFFARPTAALDWWLPDVVTAQSPASSVLAGRDLQDGGTWFGLNAEGRLALLTNIRAPSLHSPTAPSRGRIVTGWLAGAAGRDDFWADVSSAGHNPFNLIAADFASGELFWASSARSAPLPLDAGLFGLSNGLLDEPWPKVVGLKDAVARSLDAQTTGALADALFDALARPDTFPDDMLPRTGVPLEWERLLSARFIRSPDGRYGTRCSTVLITEQVGERRMTRVLERSFGTEPGAAPAERRFELPDWPPAPTS